MLHSHFSLHTIKLFAASLLLVLIVPTLTRSQGWISQNSGTTNWLYGVSMVDEANAAAVGYNGTILTTTNGGASWIPQTGGTIQPLLGIHFLNASVGVAVGRRGVIIRTINRGSTWSVVVSNTGEDLYSVTFADATNGFAVGSYGTILKSTDAGQSWSPLVSNSREVLYRAKFTSPMNGYVVGGFKEGVILRTTNGGVSWSRQAFAATTNLFGLAFANASVGLAVGMKGTMLRTTNAGSSWTLIPSTGDTSTFTSVTFFDATTAAVVGGRVLISRDAGLTWAKQYVPTPYAIDITSTNDSTGMIVGSDGLILRTGPSDGWQILSYGILPPLNGVSFADTLNGVAVGASGTIVWTTNGGTSWHPVSSGVSHELLAVEMISPSLMIVTGDSGTILKSTDKGATWTRQNSGTFRKLYGISFVSPTMGTVVGDSGLVLRTRDGGQTWLKQTLVGTIYDVAFVNASLGVAVAKPALGISYVFRTIDSGATWTYIPTASNYRPRAVAFNTLESATFVNQPGRIYRSTDAGATWNVQANVPGYLNAIAFANSQLGMIVGSDGTILGTVDGGTTWLLQSSSVRLALNSVAMPSPSFAVAVGAEGVILQTRSGVVLTTEEGDPTIARTFTLGQNYPNPFNPTTIIPFSLGQRSSVTIKVFDVLGREIALVVNGTYERGAHSASWDARKYSSGVYFYRLTIDDRAVESKKLLLIR
ncbi:MAG: T9SS type A sorting domain-containing protein [Ignavibacteriae bacterium]|nr:T9SS type A sorting domain-containing protein [Ignavibacteriota bacterium]